MTYDVIVVGAGSSGVPLAVRLSDNPELRVALVEAGPDFPTFAQTPDVIRYFSEMVGGPLGDERPDSWPTAYDWNFTAAATPERDTSVPRGRITGGTSAINGSSFVRGTREDFDSWAARGNPEWSYERVLPFLKAIETDLDFQNEFHGAAGPIGVWRTPREQWAESDLAFEAASTAAGFPQWADHNDPRSTGFGPIPRNSQDGTRVSTARAYLADARGRPNLTLYPDTLVTRVLLRGSRATGVEVVRGAARRTIEADEIVLSAGAIKSPHLLMLSGIGPAAQLAEAGVPVVVDLPGVGRNLRDHPSVVMLWQSAGDRPAAPGATLIGTTYLRFTAPGSAWRNDCRLMAPGSAATEGHPERTGMDSMYAGLYLAAGSGELTLTSADATVQPRIAYRYLDEPCDRERLRYAVRLADELARHDTLRGLLGRLIAPDPVDLTSDAALDTWLRRNVRTSHHASGTARMGPDPDGGAVVDQYLRVYGVRGLRVVDASVMPDCVRHNTNNTCIMIGERAAALMLAANHP